MTTDRWVSVPNPDDPLDLPIYEGLASEAYGKLIPGEYRTNDEDDNFRVVLVVTDTESYARDSDANGMHPNDNG